MSLRRGTAFCAPQDKSGFCEQGALALAQRATRRVSKNGIVPDGLGLVTEIKFFGRHKGGSIRDGVILSVQTASP